MSSRLCGIVYEGERDDLRQSGADYLLHALVDAIVDHYFEVLEVLGEKIEALQDLVVSDPKPETLHKIHSLKRQLMFLRRAVWPLREAANNLSRSESPFLHESTKVFFRDVYDHVDPDRGYDRNASRNGLGRSRYLSVEYQLSVEFGHEGVDDHHDDFHAVDLHRRYLRDEL